MKKLITLSVLLLLVISSFAFKVIMVTDTGGLGDKSFNDGTWAGVQKAQKELKVDVSYIISKEQTDYVTNLTNASKQADVVIAVGFMMANSLFEVAPQFPNVKYIGIDIGPSEGQTVPKNVALFLFKEHESAFMAGYVSASVSKTGKLGFIGGIEIPPVKKFELGYRAGVMAYNQKYGKNYSVIVGYAGSFGDAAKGKQMALAQYEQGADIVFAAAGATGNGAFDAAKEKTTAKTKYWAVGVDVDQDYMAPGFILTSAMKGVDTASFLGIKSAKSGRSFMTGVNILGLKEDGVQISSMKYTAKAVSETTKTELKQLIERIKKGTIIVPDSENALKTFKLK